MFSTGLSGVWEVHEEGLSLQPGITLAATTLAAGGSGRTVSLCYGSDNFYENNDRAPFFHGLSL